VRSDGPEILELEAPHKVISKTHQVRLASTPWFEFLRKPKIERKVQIQITVALPGGAAGGKTPVFKGS
jgi:hypothetical protein